MMKVKNYWFLSTILVIIIVDSCSTQEHYQSTKTGAFRYTIVRGGKASPAIIMGYMYGEEMKGPTKISGVIKIDNKIISKSDIDGKFSFPLKEGQYTFTGVAYPYNPVDTKIFTIKKGDTLKLNFYLKPAKGEFIQSKP